MSEKCRSCDRPATLALLGKEGNFDIYLCYGCLVKTVKRNLRVKSRKNLSAGQAGGSNKEE